MKIVRQIGSLAFVAGLFTAVFAGVPWHVVAADSGFLPSGRYPRGSANPGYRTKEIQDIRPGAATTRG